MSKPSVIELFSRLHTWRREAEEAPHKPLPVLYALGRWRSSRATRLAFREVDRDLTELLKEFGPERAAYHPEYPFWRLQNDGIWEVDAPEGLELPQGNTDPKKSELLRHNVQGGFTARVLAALDAEPERVFEIAQMLLDRHFPASEHQPILKRVGLTRQCS